MAAIVADALFRAPENGSASCSTRSKVARPDVGIDTVARIWRTRELRPWRTETFKLFQAPTSRPKLVDVLGFYVDPRSAPRRSPSTKRSRHWTVASRRCRSNRVGPDAHQRLRQNGTVDFLAVPDVATHDVLHKTHPTHSGRDVLALRWIDLRTSRHLDQTPRRLHRVGHPQHTASRCASGSLTASEAVVPALHPHIGLPAKPHRDMVLRTHPQRLRRHQIELYSRPHRHLGPELER